MRHTLIPLKVVFLLTIFCLTGNLSHAAVNPKPFVIPELKQWTGKEGSFIPGTDAKIVCTSSDSELLRIAHMFADDYQQMFGQTLSVTEGKAKAGDFILSLSTDKKLGKEGYAIKIADRVTLSAPTPTGLYWSTRTLLQIAEQTADHQLPQGIIRDYPDYPIRGFMIDCGRKFIPMPYLQDLVKIMAYYKMNALQVHLNDNGFKQFFGHDWDKTYAAFRLESDTYPGLAARDGFYTKKEFVDFQHQAAAQFVEIIPEIDIPAHSLAFAHYKPEIGSKEYGMDHLDLFKPETYEFADALFKEYLEGENPIFVGKRVHIGTDEYSNAKKDVVEKFREFTDHYIRFVESFGKQAMVWGALTHAKGETPVKSENVIMNAWYNGYADPETMIKEGYRLISIPDGMVYLVPAAGYYYDYLNEPFLYNKWTPAHIGKAVFEEQHPAILGGMFAVWNDHVGNGISVKDVHHRVFPALQTLAVKMWTGAHTSLPYEAYNEKRAAISEAPGVNQMGRIGKSPALVYERATVAPGSTSDHPEIGYNYTVSFDITGADEKNGTELFRSANAVFYLTDPIRGMMGFARDGYLNTFPYKVNPGEKATVQIEGDNRSTTLKVNGKVIEKMDIQKIYFNAGKDSINYVRTLVFPLEKAGKFNSRIENLKVYNYCVSRQ
ncbi:family 20 glycosylhydrolase [Bacteroides acidifaciens]|uniref:family 20 glycosylhydrolase n=1 Tax=Bacteroides acidifaciens TaxID=85831 RepID=UPI000AEF9531|nr:family 20 glycosylhydrolase [Bacteroides acidifaciens]MCR1999970.1 family 20 glycosylhydrolase [Bacteroides acidifaciens]